MDDQIDTSHPVRLQEDMRRRVRVYIDGFNLYHAIVELKDTRLKWLNFKKLSETLLRQEEILDEVNLFTAVLTWDQQKQQRHENFLKACTAVDVRVHRANFKRSYKRCMTFDRTCKFQEEKQTDVAIAVKMVADALSGSVNRVILITADSDQVPAVKFIRGLPNVEVSIVFPPGRRTVARELSSYSTNTPVELASGRLLTCMLPRSVFDSAGKLVATMPAIYHMP